MALGRSSVPLAGPLAPLVMDRQRNEVVVDGHGRQAVPEVKAPFLVRDDPASEQFLDGFLRTVRPKVDRDGFKRRNLGPRHAFARVFGHLSAYYSRLSGLDPLHRDTKTIRENGREFKEKRFCQNDYMWTAELLRPISTLGLASCHHWACLAAPR